MEGNSGHVLAGQALLSFDHGAVMETIPFRSLLDQVLNVMGKAVIIVNLDGEVIYSTPSAGRMLEDGDGLLVAGSVLKSSMDTEYGPLEEFLHGLLHEGSATLAPVREVYIERPSGKAPYQLGIHVLEQTENPDREEMSGALIIVRDMNANQTGLYERLQSRYKLTLRECECAHLLAFYHDPEDILARLGVTEHTLRQHQKNIYKKMGLHKQHELVSVVRKMYRLR